MSVVADSSLRSCLGHLVASQYHYPVVIAIGSPGRSMCNALSNMRILHMHVQTQAHATKADACKVSLGDVQARLNTEAERARACTAELAPACQAYVLKRALVHRNIKLMSLEKFILLSNSSLSSELLRNLTKCSSNVYIRRMKILWQ